MGQSTGALSLLLCIEVTSHHNVLHEREVNELLLRKSTAGAAVQRTTIQEKRVPSSSRVALSEKLEPI